MPELPEVESIRQQLRKFLIGHVIEDVEIRYGKKFEGDPKNLIGGKIVNVRRFGKAQSIDLDNGYSILIHIKMTGQMIYEGPNIPPIKNLSKKVTGGLGGKHTHIIFHLDSGGKLYYNDVRKFGWIHVHKTSDVANHRFISKLGPELNLTDGYEGKELTLEIFKNILSKSSRPVKTVIMDQEKMGGIGNIYANEALWEAGISPKKPASTLSESEAEKLYESIVKVLKLGLKYKGASELAYVTPDGSEGEYQNHTVAYGHEGEQCTRCKKAKLEKYFLGGRGTYWCPNCQR